MRKQQNGILLAGKASDEVTGSMYLVTFNGYNILIECGLYQSSDLWEAYRINTKKFPFDPKKIDYIFLEHPHIDHSGLIPRLYKEGCHARIIMTKTCAEIVMLLWENSGYIMAKTAVRLSKQSGRVYEPEYTKDDIDRALTFIDYYDEYDRIYQLAEGVRFQWLKNGHCLGATQLQLILGTNGETRKILYTSDIGALKPINHFMTETEIPNFHNDIHLMETTYGNPTRAIKTSREHELMKVRGVIRNTFAKHGQVIFPAFAFAKMQELIVSLYEMYHDDPSFKEKIYVDTMLGVDICKAYERVLTGEDKELWKKVLHWDKLVLVREYPDSEALLNDGHSKIVISASGFATNGRVVNHLKKVIKDENSTIIISGYPGANEGYLARRLVNYKEQGKKKISIDGVEYPYRANLVVMETVSSHADFNGLLTYGGHVRTNKLVLIHGDMEGREALKPILEEERSRNNLNMCVEIGKQGMFLKL